MNWKPQVENPPAPQRVLVCGGRDYADSYKMHKELFALRKNADPDIDHTTSLQSNLVIIEGGYRGADALARKWAADWGCRCITEKADWEQYGKKAGPIRNREMMKHKPDLVLAFPGGDGTADMISVAEEAGVPVRRVT